MANQQAFEAAMRLGIVRDEDVKNGHVYWVWRFEDEKSLPAGPPGLADRRTAPAQLEATKTRAVGLRQVGGDAN